MADERKISLVIPNYNRVDLVLEAFEKVYNDDRISEIIISDDHSDRAVFNQLESLFKMLPKIKHFRNDRNMDCYVNKKIAVELAINEWVILLDSDNIIDVGYLDKIFDIDKWDTSTIYTPDCASPQFDFIRFSGILISRDNVSSLINEPLFEVLLNACNYFVNRHEYLKIWDGAIDPVTSDSIFMCLNWLRAGNEIKVVNRMKYFHRIHTGSHYRNNVQRTPNGFHDEILNQLRQLSWRKDTLQENMT